MTGRSCGRRRLLSLLATGVATSLTGCSGLFTQPESESTPTTTPTPTPAPTTTPTPTPTTTPKPTATPAPSSAPLDITGYEISFEGREGGKFTAATVVINIEKTGNRSIKSVELRVAMVYAPETENRVVAVDYVGGSLNGDDDNSGQIMYRTRFPTDGRADGSTDPDDFVLRFRVAHVEYA